MLKITPSPAHSHKSFAGCIVRPYENGARALPAA